MKVTDLARAIEPNCAQEIVGIRPGEKIHETLIGKDEGHCAIEFDGFYIIRPNHSDEWIDSCIKDGGHPCPEGFSYTSNNNPDNISVKELCVILEKIAEDYSIEKSRWSMKGVPK